MPLNEIPVTRLPAGLSTNQDGKIFSSFPIPDFTKFHIYDNDFDQYVAADWVKTSTGAGTAALISGDGGQVSLANSAANADINQIQKTPAAFLLNPLKKAFGKYRVQVDDATLAAFAVGLQLVNVDGNSLAVATQGIFFSKAAAAATINFYVRLNNAAGSNVAAAIASMVNATFIDLAWYYDGNGRIWYSVNDTVLGALDATVTYFPTVILSPIVAVKNGSAVARTAIADRTFHAVER